MPNDENKEIIKDPRFAALIIQNDRLIEQIILMRKDITSVNRNLSDIRVAIGKLTQLQGKAMSDAIPWEDR